MRAETTRILLPPGAACFFSSLSLALFARFIFSSSLRPSPRPPPACSRATKKGLEAKRNVGRRERSKRGAKPEARRASKRLKMRENSRAGREEKMRQRARKRSKRRSKRSREMKDKGCSEDSGIIQVLCMARLSVDDRMKQVERKKLPTRREIYENIFAYIFFAFSFCSLTCLSKRSWSCKEHPEKTEKTIFFSPP
ncbi:putative transmembrane protein [Toxoplasma gondii MAS]|uniref:Putative transmembrane protein n=1 Tax=Toxoplasma gondii MAS TaxID=943118 RepID=A0A086QNS4_TOXGO|nr:putative transmembrane protein [Toxoplasma gondii MAS]